LKKMNTAQGLLSAFFPLIGMGIVPFVVVHIANKEETSKAWALLVFLILTYLGLFVLLS